MKKPRFEDYDFEIRRICAEDGGGYSITFPDLPGCRSDGEDPSEAESNGRDAFNAWVQACLSEGREVPKPGSRDETPAKFLQRVPRYIHAKIVELARQQGVSVNALVHGFICEGIERVEATSRPKPYVGVVERQDIFYTIGLSTEATSAGESLNTIVSSCPISSHEAGAVSHLLVAEYAQRRRMHG